MGRPIQKKFFGNTFDPPIGGEGIASIAIGGTNTDKTAVPPIVIAAPPLPGGVQAVARARMEVETIINFTSGAGYTPAQVLTLTGGTGTQATITVDTTRVTNLVVGTNAGSGYAPGDVVTIQGGTGTLATATVGTVDGGGGVLTFSIFTPGSYTVNPGTLTDAATVKVGGLGDDLLTVTFEMGIDTVTLTTTGDYTALPADISIVGHSGPGGALFNLDYRVKSVEVTTAGSGYTSAPAITTQGGTTFTATLTSGTGGNAIIVSAFVPGGSSAVSGDIVKQTASRAYRVATAQGTGRCDLVAAAPTEGQLTMTAIDSAGGTYYVLKLTARRALIVKGDRSGVQFTTGTTGISVPWSLDAAVLNERVQILNA
jgi:hypothetical protein